MPLCANCSQLKGLALFPSLSPDICISIEFAFVHKSHVCVKRWIWMLQMTPLHVLTLVVVCVFIHVCMSTREHWGAFRLQTPPSPHRAVWSCWNSESEPAASTHISSATWPKKQDQHLWFFFFLLGASWTTACWPCHARTKSMKWSQCICPGTFTHYYKLTLRVARFCWIQKSTSWGQAGRGQRSLREVTVYHSLYFITSGFAGQQTALRLT